MFANTSITIDGLDKLLEALKTLPSSILTQVNTAIWYDGLRTGVAIGAIAVLALWLFSNNLRKGT